MTRHRVTQIISQWRVWVVLLLLLGTGGCGGSGIVSGKVKYKGNLLPTGQVVFFDSKDRQVGTATINSDGSYKATVPTGSLKIAVTTPPSSTLRSLPEGKSKAVKEAIQKMKKGAFNPLEGEDKDLIPVKSIPIPAKYADPTNSGLSLTVSGGSQSFDIDLQ
jgi:hypothetical protein